MTGPLPPRVLDIEGAWMVAGTHDPVVALGLLLDWSHGDSPWPWVPGAQPTAAEVEEWANGFAHRADQRYLRNVPAMRGNCACGEGHSFDVFDSRPGGRGVYRAVSWEQ